ncbi:MAG: tautomerase family protein [Pseudomonadota bacterium]
MPFVNIRIVKEVIEDDPVGKKAKINQAVVEGINKSTGIPEESIWVVFEEVPETEWFSGMTRVKELRAQT